jgi:hypothetical protein
MDLSVPLLGVVSRGCSLSATSGSASGVRHLLLHNSSFSSDFASIWLMLRMLSPLKGNRSTRLSEQVGWLNELYTYVIALTGASYFSSTTAITVYMLAMEIKLEPVVFQEI